MKRTVSYQNASKRIASLKVSNKIELLLSCEHGGNSIPGEFADLFAGSEETILSHRGYDKGALEIARYVSQELSVSLIFSETTRLLVDLNRSLHHRQLFSEFTMDCSVDLKDRILNEYYYPYRNRVITAVDSARSHNKPVLHLSFHSFTPVLAGKKRSVDLGLLYDPSRLVEKEFCWNFRDAFNKASEFKVRMNYPYRGSADGLTTALRKKYPARFYSGIEIEINQKFSDNSNTLISIADQFCAALETVLSKYVSAAHPNLFYPA